MKSALLGLVLVGTPCFAGGKSYVIDPGKSEVTVEVGKSGLLKFTGHEHRVLARAFSGRIQADPESLPSSSVQISFDATALKVDEKGEPEGDASKVEARMLGTDVLDASRFPKIEFQSRTVAGSARPDGTYELTVSGEISLHGASKPLSIPVKVTIAGDSLTVVGHLSLRQTDFGITPVSVAGVVKVRNEVGIDFKIAAGLER
jgi:polyisoprenoid-binding protein YceI